MTASLLVTNWDLGEYERTAERLAPAADVAAEALAASAGHRIVDVGCGTGNAALAAARMGASVVGVDVSERLLGVARDRARAEDLQAEFLAGDAAALPMQDATFDGAVSVFGVIFADAGTAAGELVRVVRPGGRIVVTTWTTEGPTPRIMAAVQDALGAPPSPPRWSDPGVVRELFAPHRVEIGEARLAFTATSAQAYLAEQFEHHPMWLAAAPALEARGRLEDVVERATAILEDANEEPGAFRTTTAYHVVRVDVGAA